MKSFQFRRGLLMSMFEAGYVPQSASYTTEPIDLGAEFSGSLNAYVGALTGVASYNAGTVAAIPGVVLTNSSTAVSVTSIAGLAAGQSIGGTHIPAGATIASLTAGADDVTLAGVTLTNTSTAVTVTSTAGLVVGQQIAGTSIPAGTTISAIGSSTALTLSAAATGTASGSYVVTNLLTLSAAATGTASGTYTAANVYTHTAQCCADNSSWSNCGTPVAITGPGITYAPITITGRYVRRSVTIAGYLPSIASKSWLDAGGEPGKDYGVAEGL